MLRTNRFSIQWVIFCGGNGAALECVRGGRLKGGGNCVWSERELGGICKGRVS